MKNKVIKAVVRIVLVVFVVVVPVWIYITQPTIRTNSKSSVKVDAARLKAHVVALSKDLSPRNYKAIDNLNKCADYVYDNFVRAGAVAERQEFEVNGRRYINVIGRFGQEKAKQVIIGAHYDAATGTPGADDNASGVAGLIELAYLIGQGNLDKGVELVAYSLEEPPFFGTDMMGSAVHAANLGKRRIEGVIVLEMIGCFNDRWGSQSYPMALMNILYPNRGNFIAVIGKTGQTEFTKSVKAGMKGATDLPVYSTNAPEFIPGVDFSDHRNYWAHDLKAVMITDTAFYRNKEYHEAGDTADRLDYGRMEKVVIGVFEAITKL